MSRQQVRNAVAKWIAEEQIPTLNQVFTSFPKRINFQEMAFPGQLSRAAAVVFIESESETRIAIGGAYSGWKQVDYAVSLQVFHHSMQRNAEDAMTDFDILVDAIQDRLRGGGHRLGVIDPSIIWQAAEPNINADYGEPLTSAGGATETWVAIRFIVTQMIKA